MSIEAMKRIKSLLQDGDKIDSHTISAVVAECDAVILTQQPDNAACKSVQKRLEAQQPATGEPVARSEREQLRHAQAAVVMPMIGPLLDAWENSDREVMSQEPELSKQLKNINSAMEDADTHPSPSVPDDVVRVPVQVLKDASEALGNFVSDHGWGDTDMQAMDNLDAYIARHEARRSAMLAAK